VGGAIFRPELAKSIRVILIVGGTSAAGRRISLRSVIVVAGSGVAVAIAALGRAGKERSESGLTRAIAVGYEISTVERADRRVGVGAAKIVGAPPAVEASALLQIDP
jgi:hypothetical protein